MAGNKNSFFIKKNSFFIKKMIKVKVLVLQYIRIKKTKWKTLSWRLLIAQGLKHSASIDTDLCLCFAWFGRGIWDQKRTLKNFQSSSTLIYFYWLNVCSSTKPIFIASLISWGTSVPYISSLLAKTVNLVDDLLKQETYWYSNCSASI